MQLRGCYTAMVTPFLDNGDVDYNGLKRNVEFQIRNGIKGLVPLGTTGESPTVTAEERKQIIRTVVETAAGRVKVIPGTGTYSTAASVANSRVAVDLGADAVLIVSPYYNKPSQEGLFRHYMTIAEAVEVPVIVYNIQGRTGRNVETPTLVRLAEHPNIIAVKEASGSIPQMMDVIASLPAGFSVVSGDDNLTYTLLALGGHGAISVLSNLVPHRIVEMVETAGSGDLARARDLHYRLLPLFKAVFLETNPIPIKTMMNWQGLPAGAFRLPMCPISPVHEPALRQIMESSELVT